MKGLKVVLGLVVVLNVLLVDSLLAAENWWN